MWVPTHLFVFSPKNAKRQKQAPLTLFFYVISLRAFRFPFEGVNDAVVSAPGLRKGRRDDTGGGAARSAARSGRTGTRRNPIKGERFLFVIPFSFRRVPKMGDATRFFFFLFILFVCSVHFFRLAHFPPDADGSSSPARNPLVLPSASSQCVFASTSQ